MERGRRRTGVQIVVCEGGAGVVAERTVGVAAVAARLAGDAAHVLQRGARA